MRSATTTRNHIPSQVKTQINRKSTEEDIQPQCVRKECNSIREQNEHSSRSCEKRMLTR